MLKFNYSFYHCIIKGQTVSSYSKSLEKKYQKGLMDKLKSNEESLVLADGRHDSMGHSAKYRAYTIFCCTEPAVINFSLVQV